MRRMSLEPVFDSERPDHNSQAIMGNGSKYHRPFLHRLSALPEAEDTVVGFRLAHDSPGLRRTLGMSYLANVWGLHERRRKNMLNFLQSRREFEQTQYVGFRLVVST